MIREHGLPQVDILIQGRSYAVQCAEGEEKRAHFLAAHINRHAARLVARLGAMPDAQLLLMTGMMVADELLEARERLERLQGERQRDGDGAERERKRKREEDVPLPLEEDRDAAAAAEGDGGALSARIEATSRRLESIAAMLEPGAHDPQEPE